MTPRITDRPECSVEWCTRPVRTMGLCQTCYGRRWARKKQATDPSAKRAANRRWAASRPIVPVTVSEKQCGKCRVVKTADEFHRQKRGADGLQAACKSCAAQSQLDYALIRRCRNVGITVEHYWRLMREQCGMCGVCGKRQASDLDHCHATGRFRGLVCAACNRILGTVQDDADHLRALIRHLDPEHGDSRSAAN